MKISDLPGWFSQQNLRGRLAIGAVGAVLLLCLLSGLSTVYTRFAQVPSATPTFLGAESVLLITWTPDGSATPTASITPTGTQVPTRTPLPTSLPTRGLETSTIVVLPTVIRPALQGSFIAIVFVDKELEYVDIQNLSGAPVFLRDWTLVSERGEQTCELNGIMQPNEVLRIWAGTNEVGYSCGFLRTIWTDNELDPAILYNPQGQEISRYPP